MDERADWRERLQARLQSLQRRVGSEGPLLSRDEASDLLHLVEELAADLEGTRRRVERLARNQQNLDDLVVAVEHRHVFRALRWASRTAESWKARWHPLYLKLVPHPVRADAYAAWLDRRRASAPAPEELRRRAAEFRRRPSLSIVLPVHNPVREWLAQAVDSLAAQSYPCWELCACDDASAESWPAEFFRRRASQDTRIRFIRSDTHLGISGALNAAGRLASGEYVGFLDQDDALAPGALHYFVEELQRHDPVLMYSDEDQLDNASHRSHPTFKPDWDPELLTNCMYAGRMLVAARAELDRAGWFRSEFDGSQDYDLLLRLSEGPGVVRHIPRVLYHRRRREGSSQAGRRALEDAIRRRGWQAQVRDRGPATFALRRQPGGQSKATLVICSRNAKLLKRCLAAIERMTDYANRELVVVHHRAGKAAAMDRLLCGADCTVIGYDGPFDFSRMNNRGVEAATGEVVVFLNDDVEPLAREWLSALVAQVERPEVGVAGARLLYPSGSVQHAGIAIGIVDGAGHPGRRWFGSPYWPWLAMTRSVSAVTGACLAMRKRLFRELGGFDPAFPVNYNDVDLCLRVRRAGYAVICESAAVLRHREAQTRVPVVCWHERELMYERWGEELDRGDPYYNPNLTRVREDAWLRGEEF